MSFQTEYGEKIIAAASKFQTPPVIHDDDHLFRIILKQRPTDGVERYFEGGARDSRTIRSTIDWLFPDRTDLRILDFASGYGRIVRHMKIQSPGCEVVASDIHPQACAFMRDKFGIETHLSTHDPSSADLGGPCDFIYVLSLFSHLPPHSFGGWLSTLYNHLKPGGHIVLTANGDAARAKLADRLLPCYDEEKGYGYRPVVVDQPDISTEEYGSMSISFRFFLDAVDALDGLARITSFRSCAWFAQQDEWIVSKLA